MFKLPVCPHCSTIYRYSEVKKTAFKKKQICYHCKKEFNISKKGIIVLALLVICAAAALNLAQLYITPSLSLLFLLATNIILVAVGALLIPFFITYKGSNKKENKSDKAEKNVKKQK